MLLESLEELRVFVQVVDSGGFTGAANTLGTTTNAVSRLVARLEARLQVRLLSRTTRRVASTDEGRRLYEHALRLLRAAEDAELAVQASAEQLQGTVRVAVRTTTVQFGFVNDIASLLASQPDLRVQLIVSDADIDLAAEGIDVALRVGELADSAYRSHPLGAVVFVPAATPNYLDQRARPQHPDDLAQHECIRGLLQRPQTFWRLVGPRRRVVDALVSGRLECNDVRAQAEAVYSGLGIGLRPIGEVRAATEVGQLERVLPGWSMAPLPVHALLSPQRSRNARTDAVVQLLKTAVQRLA
ncbi:MAG: LysR family transcriptional regulator [Rhodoferax sp.]|nr:LysR family transcriptional regulator [Rhodoferax sp.]